MGDSNHLCRQIADICPEAVCSFSMGKDSIAAYIQMARHFDRVELLFYYMVPGLEFQEAALAYYENKLGKKIKRMPNPSLYRQLESLMFQSPANVDAIFDANLYVCTYEDVIAAAKHDWKMSEDSYIGIGVRQDDSIVRRISIKRNGAANHPKRQFYPVFDWSLDKVRQEIRQSGIKLPIDYKIWSRSFDGFDYRFLKPLKDNFPRDYEKIREFFPLIELEIKRYEKAK